MGVLVTGAAGQLGGYLLRALSARGQVVVGWSHTGKAAVCGVGLEPVELTEPDQVRDAFLRARPRVVIHAAAMSRVSECRRDPERAWSVNRDATGRLADLCRRHEAWLIHVSTDLVFDGRRPPYREQDQPAPLSVYGQTKAAGEREVLEQGGLVVRMSLLYGPSCVGRPTFFDRQVSALRQGQPVRLFGNEWRTPLALVTAAEALSELACGTGRLVGLLHVGGPQRMSRLEMGQRLAWWLGADPALCLSVSRNSDPAEEPRPEDTSLDSSFWRALFPRLPWPRFEEALAAM